MKNEINLNQTEVWIFDILKELKIPSDYSSQSKIAKEHSIIGRSNSEIPQNKYFLQFTQGQTLTI